jgi:hypothetical protein
MGRRIIAAIVTVSIMVAGFCLVGWTIETTGLQESEVAYPWIWFASIVLVIWFASWAARSLSPPISKSNY